MFVLTLLLLCLVCLSVTDLRTPPKLVSIPSCPYTTSLDVDDPFRIPFFKVPLIHFGRFSIIDSSFFYETSKPSLHISSASSRYKAPVPAHPLGRPASIDYNFLQGSVFSSFPSCTMVIVSLLSIITSTFFLTIKLFSLGHCFCCFSIPDLKKPPSKLACFFLLLFTVHSCMFSLLLLGTLAHQEVVLDDFRVEVEDVFVQLMDKYSSTIRNSIEVIPSEMMDQIDGLDDWILHEQSLDSYSNQMVDNGQSWVGFYSSTILSFSKTFCLILSGVLLIFILLLFRSLFANNSLILKNGAVTTSMFFFLSFVHFEFWFDHNFFIDLDYFL
ncbi:hypothetical protein GEMRC1_011303 [Eukaryota sp. GEM-RC1]